MSSAGSGLSRMFELVSSNICGAVIVLTGSAGNLDP